MAYLSEHLSVMTVGESTEAENRLHLEKLYEASRRVQPAPPLYQVLQQVIKMTQYLLDASAASILLFRDNDHELYFEAATGPVSKSLRHVRLSTQYGIAGQVARTGKPLIVNDVMRSEKFHKMIDDTTGFCTRSLICAPLIANDNILGVVEVLNKRDGSNFEEPDLQAAVYVANTAALAIENARMHQIIMDAFKDTAVQIALAVDSRDIHSAGHSRRVMEYTTLAGSFLSLAPAEMEILGFASALHDIGKMTIDHRLITKPGALTAEEWNIIQEHPARGAEIVRHISYLAGAADIILCHHERYDGGGYPNGLKGEEIPMGARLITVADAFDTMTTSRSYRTAMSVSMAVKELHHCAGYQFCPIAVKAFVAGLRLRSVA